ncbi:MAG: phosphoribosylamine--glycine ligase N-terminal domain-containing protein, partial [Chloroflexota bacterium]
MSGAGRGSIPWSGSSPQSPKAEEIYAAPGNAGTARIAYNLDINPTDIESLAKAAREKGVELV